MANFDGCVRATILVLKMTAIDEYFVSTIPGVNTVRSLTFLIQPEQYHY